MYFRLADAGGVFEEVGRAFDDIRLRCGRNILPEKVADEFAERLVGRAIAGVVDVVFEVGHQFVGGRVTLGQIAREAFLEDVVELAVNARVKPAEIGNRLLHDAVARFVGGLALENIFAQEQVRQHDAGGKQVGALVGDLEIGLLGTHVIGLAGDDFTFLIGQ